MASVHTKNAFHREVEIYRLANTHSIAPDIISVTPSPTNPRRVLLRSQLYPEVLIDVMRDGGRREEVIYMVIFPKIT